MTNQKNSEEYERFDRTMKALLKVPHSEIKAKLDAEKADKKKKRSTKGNQNDATDRDTN